MDSQSGNKGFVNLFSLLAVGFLVFSLVAGVFVVNNKFFNLDIRKRASEGEYFFVSPTSSPSYRIITTPTPVPKKTRKPNSTPTPIKSGIPTPTPMKILPTPVTLKTIGDVFSDEIDNLINK